MSELAEDNRGCVTPQRVLVVTNVRIHGTLMRAVLGAIPGIEIVASVDTTNCTSSSIADFRVSLIVVDASSVIASTLRDLVSAAAAQVSFLVYALDDRDETSMLDYLQLGTTGFLTYDVDLDAIKEALVAVIDGQIRCSSRITAFFVRRFGHEVQIARHRWPLSHLSTREREVALLYASHLEAKEVGRRLGIADSTVERHLARIYKKLDVHSREQLADVLTSLRNK